MKNLVNYALAYQAKGLSVLPIAGKQPLIKFADRAPLTADEIKAIWQKHPFAQIALRTDEFFVVDIDRNHDDNVDGFNSIKQLPAEYFPETLTQTTRHGGQQLFYLKRNDMRVNQLIGYLPGVDVKAHQNNYVVVAPSDGYKWLNKHAIVTAPKSLVVHINQMRASSRRSSPNDLVLKPRERNSTTDLLETIANGLGDKGMRNKTLAGMIGALLFRGVNAQAAYQLAMICNENTLDPLPEEEVNRTFQSMLKRDMRNGGELRGG
ncbi:DNA primase [Limosilactobacillus reuteri]|uniref:DNA primase n=1 Tax=Limosilactobacillus reuteri TaxID=1598 RepID=A0A517D482_LIMRT|nr:bifunctional DNA primase/polymerase [Limosilactobacillus reuteri]QDR72154.1 DNA primase [Limosilactobacillus reuteri]